MTNRIPKNFIQDIVTRSDIVALIESRIELKKRGNTHVACCPFHSEKTPSFTVSQTKQFYYCFGCGAHGNVIGFLMEYDHLTFVDAVTDLAQQLGLTVPLEKNDAEIAQFDVFYRLLHDAQLLYQVALKKSSTAITYLKNRGLTGKVAKDFGIGYAPNAWEFLSQTLGKSKTEREALATTGMTIEKNPAHYYDRFRDRIIFPIRDARGRTIGFGGRTLTNETPKYLNSPETPIFHKSQTLYGLYEMCQHQRKLQRALIVEGYLDVISLAQQDIHYAVATLGTAFNVKHTQLLLRYTSDIIFCFDGDNAGRKAAWKALTISLPLLRDGINLRVLFLPPNEDPDSLVRKIGKTAFEKLIDRAHPLSTVFFEELEKEFPLNSIANKAAFAKQANEHLNTMPDGIYKNLLLDALATHLQMAREKITPTSISKNNTTKQNIKLTTPRLHERLTPIQSAIQLLLHHPEFAADTVDFAATTKNNTSAEKKLLLDLITRCTEQPALPIGELLEDTPDPAQRALIAAIATYPLHIPFEGRNAEFRDALKRLHEQDQSQELAHLIAKAGDTELSTEEKEQVKLLLSKKNTITTSQE
ncbi:MAG: DNA primase [Gammaproteobacteria bacterium CG_4_10_14_0_8_um_filter_38_16]|nr:MAG: DNA primase [Gammaproteobacteria bacterium CG_4_10_14_0_8_um_filter_38_16]PJA02707.1 MAG: DNA primase [Gammaproteobacteria bacterium CG_4_10_14_0_2_um_filter_38_22]PJB09785.1 MAG: DNA primase [Gammaproteobacteria bacterium CG_4_9_14_3_um_filter_38_9]